MDIPRVLLVDDEPAIRLALSKWFTRQGWTVDEAETGSDAADILRAVNTRLDLVVCDVQLPGCSGLELAALVEAQWPELLSRFVFTTGAHVEFDASHDVIRERTHVLLKPFDFGSLLALVNDVVPMGETAA